MENIDLKKKRKDIDKIREEVYQNAIKGGDKDFLWDITELANKLELDMIFYTDEHQYDFKIFLDLTSNQMQKISRFVAYMREFLTMFCKNKKVVINVRID